MGKLLAIAVLGLAAVACSSPRGGDTDAPAVDLGAGYEYSEATLSRFRLLLIDEGWSLAAPPRNSQQMLRVIHERTGLAFVLIPAGPNRMGSTEGTEEGEWEDEGPIVRVPAFLLCETECTQMAWRTAGGENTSRWKADLLPVENVSWERTREWCHGIGLRLPSEAEWEYACRAGTMTRWCFGNDVEILPDYAWFCANSGDRLHAADANLDPERADELGLRTHPAGQKLPNRWGLFDVHGNVWEWCEDLWHADFDGIPLDGSPWTAQDPDSPTEHRRYRGGCWLANFWYCRSANRVYIDLQDHLRVGFRPAADLPPLKEDDGD